VCPRICTCPGWIPQGATPDRCRLAADGNLRRHGAERKLTIYDKGFDESAEHWGEYIARSGPATSPQIPDTEPLALEVEHFVRAIQDGLTPRSDGHSGLRVVRVLESLQAQLDLTRR